VNVLIVGGAGFIGSQTAKHVAAAGLTPVVFDNMSSGHRWALRWGVFEEGDIGDRQAVDRVLAEHSISAVIHLASFIQVGESVREPRKYFQNNLAATLTLLDAMVARGVRNIVFSSSAAVYGNPVRVPLDEEHPIAPLSPYGDSKMFVERVLHWYGGAYGLRWATLRYFNAAGADPDGELGEEHESESHLIPLALSAALGGPGLSVFGTDYPTRDGTAIRDYIHVADLSDAHVLALRHLAGGGASFAANVGTGTGHSVQEVINSVERIAGRPVVRQAVARREGDSPELVADARKIKALLGWRPRHPELDVMVEHAHRWMLAQRGMLAQRAR
jgi:UDP-glucose-4-epimerase GalE